MTYLPDSILLIKKALWLCKIRWFAAGGVLITVLLSKLFLKLQLDYSKLLVIAGFLFISNLIHILYLNSLRNKSEEKNLIRVKTNVNFQIFSDFIFLTVLLHFSGGIENPFVIFYIFHMIISSILLSKRLTYIHTTIGILMITSLAVTEYLGILPHYPINKYLYSLIRENPQFILAALLIFTLTSYLLVYFTSTLSGKLIKFESKLKLANIDLLEKDKIKNEYVIRVTHNIKGHIAAITSNLEVVYKQIVAPLDPGNMVFVEKAYNRAIKMSEFIYDLLALTHMKLNQKLNKEQMDIVEILNSVININRTTAESKNILLTTDFEMINPHYYGMKTSIEEMINNLIQNAIKYTPEGHKVHLQVFSDEKNFKITVEDSGCGIPEDELPFIFDEFYRASNIRNTIKDGTGLGLSLVRTIVTNHLGNISVESGVDRGSKFIVTLPHIK